MMKIGVTCIYWFLLLTSIVSSCLLFILVASEGVKASSSIASPSSEQDAASSKINTSEGGRTQTTPDKTSGAAVVERADIRSSFDDVTTQESENTAKEGFSLSHNAGLASGLSNAGPAVVFTLVDTASAELQQRAAADIPSHITTERTNASQQLKYTPTVLVQPSSDVENQTSDGQDVNQDYVVRAEPKVLSGSEDRTEAQSTNHTKHVTTEQQTLNVSVEEREQAKEEHEDIPSFSEWTQKQLEEAEKKKEKVNTSSHTQQTYKATSGLKVRSKNYASPDCGAKIVAANPEAVSAGSVLTPSRDEYKLNTCTSRIWFVVELCEAIQAKKIDLANFELFSSSPKDFTVSVSDRFPSRDWTTVGQFQARDERDVQSFNLNPHLFVKFIKVELLSHWGSEHFCPISLFRVYGTSEFEVLETEEELVRESMSAGAGDDDDDDDDETLDSYKGESTNNLFGSARDAVMSIVKKAAEVLAKSGDGSNQTEREQRNYSTASPALLNTCSTPSHLVVCDNCSDVLFGNVYELLSCKRDHLKSLLALSIVNKSLYNTDICVQYGLNFYSKSADSTTESYSRYISTFFTPEYIAAFCNVLAVLENKIVLNISSQYSNTSSINTTSPPSFSNESDKSDQKSMHSESTPCPSGGKTIETNTCASGTKASSEHAEHTISSVIKESSYTNVPIELQIKPTRTLSKDHYKLHSSAADILDEPSTILAPSEQAQLPKAPESVTAYLKWDNNNTEMDGELTATDTASSVVTDTNLMPEITDNFEIAHEQLDKFFSDLNLDTETGHSSASTATTAMPPSNMPQQAQKESVFLRLSNRIKALERNMSLSGQYLEELSRRYKKQVEEMQRVFEKKLAVLTEENKRREERKVKLEEQLERLTATVDSLLLERDSQWKTATLLGQFLLIEVFITCILLYFCWKSPENNQNGTKVKKRNVTIQVKRRKSIDAIGHKSPVLQRCRRPSEEALRISGTYEDLLINEEANAASITKAEKRRRRKRNSLLRTQSMAAPPAATCQKCSTSSVAEARRASTSEMAHPTLLPILPTRTVCVNGDITPSPPVKLDETIPFPLEESEHSSVEPVNYFGETVSETISSEHNIQKNRSSNATKTSKNGSIKSSILKSHSPLFMKTALSSRSKRNSSAKKLSIFKTDKVVDPEITLEISSHRKSPDPSLKSNSLSYSDSQDDQTSMNSDDTSKKEKKSGGFKKIFKRVFD